MEQEWIAALRQHSCPLPGPGDGEVSTVAPANLDVLARRFGCSLRQLELLALREGLLPQRYLRSLGTVGWEGQQRLLRSCVAIIGCGGLGGYVIESLARAGVGRLVLVDGDRFVPHNMNRQLLSTLTTLDRFKVEVACQRVAEVNPAVEVRAHALRATAENLLQLLEEAEVVVDALDNPRDRLVLQAAARQRRIPLVHGAIAGYIGQVTTVLPGDDALTLLYGEEEEAPEYGAERFLGTPAVTPMVVAACQAAEVLKLLLAQGDPLRGRLLLFDLEAGTTEIFPLLEMGI